MFRVNISNIRIIATLASLRYYEILHADVFIKAILKILAQVTLIDELSKLRAQVEIVKLLKISLMIFGLSLDFSKHAFNIFVKANLFLFQKVTLFPY